MTETPTLPPAPRELWLALRHGCGLSTRRLGDLTGKHSTSVLRATPATMWEMLPDAEKAAQTKAARAYLEGQKAEAFRAELGRLEAEAAAAFGVTEEAPAPRRPARDLPHIMMPPAQRITLDAAPAGRAPVFADPAALPNRSWANLTKGRKPSGLKSLRLWLTGKSADLEAVQAFLKQFGPKAAKVAGLILREAAEERRKAPQRALNPSYPRPCRERVQVAVTPDVADTLPDYLTEHGPDLGRAALAVLYQEAAKPRRTVPEYLAAVAKPPRKR